MKAGASTKLTILLFADLLARMAGGTRIPALHANDRWPDGVHWTFLP